MVVLVLETQGTFLIESNIFANVYLLIKLFHEFCSDRDQSEPAYIPGIPNADWKEIKCGAAHTVAVTKNGEVYSWGFGNNGRLGHGGFNKASYKPKLVKCLVGKFQIMNVACGSWHTAAITNNGELLTWCVYTSC
jgi:alpha-tubulin suppressor-like RCC1 family protein